MPLPGNVNTGTVTGSYTLTNGEPGVGNILFRPNVNRIIDASASVVIVPTTISVPLQSDGTFTIDLPATNDPDILPNFQYIVTEKVENGKMYLIDVLMGTTIDISVIDEYITTTGMVEFLLPPTEGGGGVLDDNSVITRFIADKAVTSAKLADGSVGLIHIQDGVITAVKVDASIATTTALNTAITTLNASISGKINLTEKGAHGGVVPLDSSGLIDPSYLPDVALVSVTPVANQAARLALTGQDIGDVAVQSDNNTGYMLQQLPSSTNANWLVISSPGAGVMTIDTLSGANITLPSNGANNVGTKRTLDGTTGSAAPWSLNLSNEGDLPTIVLSGGIPIRGSIAAPTSSNWTLVSDLTVPGKMKWAAGASPTDAVSVNFTDKLGGDLTSTNVNAAIIELRDQVEAGIVVTGRPGIPVTGCIFGAKVGQKSGQSGDERTRISALEAQFSPFTGHRIYIQPGDNFTISSTNAQLLADDATKNRTSFITARPPTGKTWAQMAADYTVAGHSQTINTELAVALGAYSHPIVVDLDHEFEVSANNKGTPADYAAWCNLFFLLIRANAPQLTTAVNYAGYQYYAGTMSAVTVKSYLGNMALIDMIAINPYNTRLSGGTNLGGFTFKALVDPWISLITSLKKPMGIFETGCTAYTASRESFWTDPVHGVLPYTKQNKIIKAVLAWHDTVAPYDAAHDFWIDDTTSLKAAIKPLQADAYFHPVSGGAGGSVAGVSADNGSSFMTGNVVIPVNGTGATPSLRTVDGTTGSALPWYASLTAVGAIPVGVSGLFGGIAGLALGAPGKVLGVDSGPGNVAGVNWITPGSTSANYLGNPIIVAASTASSTMKALATLTGGDFCDGTDDQVQIQAALDYQAVSGDGFGREVLMTAGTFTCNLVPHANPSLGGWQTVLTEKSNARLAGSGAGVTIIKLKVNAGNSTVGTGSDTNPQFNNNYVITNYSGNTGPMDTNIRNRDFRIDGTSLNGAANGQSLRHHHGIVFWKSDYTCNERIWTRNLRGTAGSGNGETFFYDCKAGYHHYNINCISEGNGVAANPATAGTTASGFCTNQGTWIYNIGCSAYKMGAMGFTTFQAQMVDNTACEAYLNLSHGFNCEGTKNQTWQGCFSGSTISAYNGATGTYAAGTNMGNSGMGFNIAPGGGQNSDGWAITGCHSENNDRGVFINSAINGVMSASVVRNNNRGVSCTGTGSNTQNIIDDTNIIEGNTTTDIEVPGFFGVWGGAANNPVPAATGVAVANPWPFKNTLYITGGTLSGSGMQLVDRYGVTTTLGTGATQVQVPVGYSVKVNYTGTLTWKWIN